MEIDELDKKILHYLSIGEPSYRQLARMCNITRNTLYRRIASLENRGIIKETIGCIINLDRIDVMPVIVGIRALEVDQDKIIGTLSKIDEVRLVWRTYGNYDIFAVAFSQKGEEGNMIKKIRIILDNLKVDHKRISVGFVWEKFDLSLFKQANEDSARLEP